MRKVVRSRPSVVSFLLQQERCRLTLCVSYLSEKKEEETETEEREREMCGKDESGKPRSFKLHPSYLHFSAVHESGKFASLHDGTSYVPISDTWHVIAIASVKMFLLL